MEERVKREGKKESGHGQTHGRALGRAQLLEGTHGRAPLSTGARAWTVKGCFEGSRGGTVVRVGTATPCAVPELGK